MSVRIINADVFDGLAQLPDESVHCVVTSPPYWGLRDYGVPGQIGLEASSAEYVTKLVDVFAEVWRVLRDDGTLWLNLGDTYAHSTIGAGGKGKQQSNAGSVLQNRSRPIASGLKPKDLVGIPWWVAFALQSYGWWLRQDIIWSKPNPMPESVTDRCTKAHEYLFLLAKSERYFFDAEAIAETSVCAGEVRKFNTSKKAARVVDGRMGSGNEHPDAAPVPIAETRNRRSVWEVTTQPFPEAHFATFPPALIEPCILAGCPERACAKCGAPWLKQQTRMGPDGEAVTVAASSRFAKRKDGSPLMGDNAYTPDELERGSFNAKDGVVQKVLAGSVPSCECNWEYTTSQGTVLDPFGGAGTTGLVADRLKRNAVLIELNPEYAEMAERRIKGDCPMFSDVEAA